jgi:hypothetical protein
MSTDNELIKMMKHRLLATKKNQNNIPYSPIKFRSSSIFKIRNSKDYLETKIDTSKKKDRKQLLFEDKINLKIIPLIKKTKCGFKYENLLLAKNYKKPKVLIFNSFALKPSKTYSKKYLFNSPFQESKKNKYKLKDMVEFSKIFHSPKFKETDINREIVKTSSRNNNKYSRNRNNFQMYLKTCGNENHLFKDIKLEKANEKSKDMSSNKYLYTEIFEENKFLRNIIINKERNRRAKNYYNQIHVNKMNKIIEKFSFINKE